MITTLADVLRALQAAEAARLKAQGISHGPTIGAMYEGLTRDIMERAVPPFLSLSVVSGFIEGSGGGLSSQVDLMLVRGQGRKIPYTDNYIWPIEDVLVVFEVKKTLLGDELLDALAKMWKVCDLARECKNAGGYSENNLSFARKTFARLTGHNPLLPDVHLLPESLQLVHFCTLMENVFPVRVILGYEGYKSEEALRKGVDRVLFEDRARGNNRGFISLPSLVMCGSSSIVKLNGFPYFNRHADFSDTWDVMASSSDNPTKVLLELVWTKISSEANLKLPMDDTLAQERMSLLFRFKYIDDVREGRRVSGFDVESFAQVPLTKDRPIAAWSPESGNELLAIILLQAVEHGAVGLEDAWYQDLCATHNANPESVLLDLVRQRTMAWINAERSRAAPIERENRIVLMPDGSVVVSDNPSLLDLWLRKDDGE
ncbi:DUF6602 domain-containing protein [Rhodanobacter hydrolyticus]|uniref:DUF6602 domain-containing protein n=1 Tax=Rhodanobacter hydrolyticus TaxID=2250595 RepID=A0ABW8J2R6_9GAMM